MLYRSFLLLNLSILVGAAILPGCGSSPAPLTAVTGTVSYQGRPLRGGTIVFTPDSSKGTFGPIASAEIRTDGSFQLVTGDASGAVAGWHRITVVAVYAPSSSAYPQHALPEKYCCPEMSGLFRQVKAGEENVIHIELE